MIGQFNVKTALVAMMAMALPAAGAAADLVVTEAMSSPGSGTTADWFELTNTGASAVSVTGFRMDDSSFAFGSSVELLGVTAIAAGESVVFLESSNAGPDVAAFRAFWGGIDLIQIATYSGSGVSLSSGGDGIIIFDVGGAIVVPATNFGAATTGASFGYDPTTSTFGGVSAVGQFGAFVSANVADNIGSPGDIPEPASLVLLGLGALAMLRRKP